MNEAIIELLGHLTAIGKQCVTYVRIVYTGWDEELMKDAVTVFEGELGYVLPKLTFEYDSGFGHEYLAGSIIWFDDGTYSDREEHDGSECWSHHSTPELPDTYPKVCGRRLENGQ